MQLGASESESRDGIKYSFVKAVTFCCCLHSNVTVNIAIRVFEVLKKLMVSVPQIEAVLRGG